MLKPEQTVGLFTVTPKIGLTIIVKVVVSAHCAKLGVNVYVVVARLFKAGDYFETASIGRVVIHPKARENKWGHQLMQQAIEAIESNFETKEITISAQLYLKKFYESHHFIQTSEMYLEDDIPHIQMKRE